MAEVTMNDQERREAAVQQVAEARQQRAAGRAAKGDQFPPVEWFARTARHEADDWWPLICQAREDGRREAAEAIEAMVTGKPGVPATWTDALHIAALRLARGAQPDPCASCGSTNHNGSTCFACGRSDGDET